MSEPTPLLDAMDDASAQMATLTEAEREVLFTRTRELSVARDTAILETIVERIVSDRLAAERERIAEKVDRKAESYTPSSTAAVRDVFGIAARVIRGE